MLVPASVERSVVRAFAPGAMSYFSFQPVPHDWRNKGCGMCYPVWCLVPASAPTTCVFSTEQTQIKLFMFFSDAYNVSNIVVCTKWAWESYFLNRVNLFYFCSDLNIWGTKLITHYPSSFFIHGKGFIIYVTRLQILAPFPKVRSFLKPKFGVLKTPTWMQKIFMVIL